MLETSILRKMGEGLFALLFPDECRICGAALRQISRVPVCARCLRASVILEAEYACVCCRTPFLNPSPLDDEGRCGFCRLGLTRFDAAYSFGSYEATLRDLIRLFKYGRVTTLARPLAEMVLTVFPRETRFDAIVPMPMHWLRRWQRGFNQAELLARHIGRRTAIPLLNPMRRRRATRAQAGLSNAQRRTNVIGAFAVKRPGQVRGRRLLVVDDVFTTGATANACAAALKRAGAAYVAVLTLARTDRRLFSTEYRAGGSVPALAVGAT